MRPKQRNTNTIQIKVNVAIYTLIYDKNGAYYMLIQHRAHYYRKPHFIKLILRAHSKTKLRQRTLILICGSALASHAIEMSDFCILYSSSLCAAAGIKVE